MYKELPDHNNKNNCYLTGPILIAASCYDVIVDANASHLQLQISLNREYKVMSNDGMYLFGLSYFGPVIQKMIKAKVMGV